MQNRTERLLSTAFITATPYALDGFRLLAEGMNEDGAGARRGLRRWRQEMAAESGVPMRILVSAWAAGTTDAVEVFGWRAALTAARALRRDYGLCGDGYHADIAVGDPRLMDVQRRYLDELDREVA